MSRRPSIRLLPWLTAAIGLALTAYAWHAARQREARTLAARFQAETEQLVRAASWEMALFADVLQSLGALHALSDRVSATAFEEFAGMGLAHQTAVLGAFGFAQWIPAALRGALEEPGPDGRPLRRLLEWGPAGGVQPAWFSSTSGSNSTGTAEDAATAFASG